MIELDLSSSKTSMGNIEDLLKTNETQATEKEPAKPALMETLALSKTVFF